MMQEGLAPGLRFVRKNDRLEMRRALGLRCQVVRERDFRLVADRAVDLSPDGMFVESDHDLEVGESLVVSFKATSLGLWFDTEASVARLVHGLRKTDRTAGFGLSFSTLDRVKRLILRGHLRRVPPPVPQRQQRVDVTKTVRSLGR